MPPRAVLKASEIARVVYALAFVTLYASSYTPSGETGTGTKRFACRPGPVAIQQPEHEGINYRNIAELQALT